MTYDEFILEFRKNPSTWLCLDNRVEQISRFPHEIFEFELLEELEIHEHLSGITVQKEDFLGLKRLKNLKSIFLIGNNLSFFPLEIFELPKLDSILFLYNKLSHVPNKFNQLKNLTHLNLEENTLKEFPLPILELQNLKILSIGGNDFESIPPEINTLKELRDLEINCSNLKNLPLELLNLKNLENFSFDDNDQFSEFPDFARYEKKEQVQKKLNAYFSNHSKSLKRKLKTLLQKQEVDQVIEILSNKIPELNYYELPKELILISNRWYFLEKEKRKGTLDFEKEISQKNKVIESLIDFIDDL